MINLFASLLALSLVANPIPPTELEGKTYVVNSCVTKERSIFLVLMLDGTQHSVLEVLNSKNEFLITRFELFEFSSNGKPRAMEFSAGIASENELALYRDFLMQKPFSFSANYNWIKAPGKLKCPIYKYSYDPQ
jgi:hypothetical protein